MMKRENRYVVLKRSDLEIVEKAGLLRPSEIDNLKSLLETVTSIRLREGKSPLQCAVVESDWPEYETVWAMIAARVDGLKDIRLQHAEWSDATFGNVGPVGPLKHLSKEAREAAKKPDDLSEWADMQFLLWDAQRRAGITDQQIIEAMEAKLPILKMRDWPEPKDGEAREHIRNGGKGTTQTSLEKPSWDSHDWPQIVQDSHGNWFGVKAGWKMSIQGGWKGDELSLLSDDGAFIKYGKSSESWKDSLEQRPTTAPQPIKVTHELLEAMNEVIRISDRDHEAWSRAKNAISACRAVIIATRSKATGDKCE